MRHFLARLLNLRHQETNLVFRLLAVQFMMGLGIAFLITASYSLFLYKYPVAGFPWVFIATAILLLPVNAVYAWVDTMYNSRRLFELCLVFCMAAVLAALGAWLLFHTMFAAVLLVAVILVVYMVLGYAYWGMASLLFDVREGRRIFSVIGAGDIPAKMIGYLLVPVIASFAGLEAALAMAVVFFLIAYVFTLRLLRSAGVNWDEFEHHQQHPIWEVPLHEWWPRIFGDKLIFRIALLSFFGYLFYYTVDFCFLSEIKVRNKSAKELTAFISTFFFAGRAIALFTKLVFSSRFLMRLGIVRTLILTPGLLFLISACLLAAGLFTGNAGFYLFGFGVLTLFSEVLRSSVQEPVFFVLFQPLSIHLRLKGHLIAKGYVLPPALLLTGGALLLYLSFSGGQLHLPGMLAILLLVLAGWMAMIPKVRRAYRIMVSRAMGRSFFPGAAMFLDDRNIIDSLIKKVENGTAVQAIHALDLLERSGYPGFSYLLQAQLKHRLPDVALFALEKIGLQHHDAATAVLLQEVMEKQTPGSALHTRARTLQWLQSAGYMHAPEVFLETLPDDRIYEVLEVLKSHPASGALPRVRAILAHHSRAMVRLQVAKHLGFDTEMQQVHLLELLLKDTEETVRKAALESAGKLGITALLPEMLRLLHAPDTTAISEKALVHMGEQLYGWPGLKLQALSDGQRRALIRIAGHLSGNASFAWLGEALQKDFFAANKEWIDACWQRGQKQPPSLRPRLEGILENGLQECRLKKDLAEGLMTSPDWIPLGDALAAEVRADLVYLVKTAGLISGQGQFYRVLQVLETSADKGRILAALEVIELHVPSRFAQKLGNLLEWAIIHRNSSAQSGIKYREERALDAIGEMISHVHIFGRWSLGLLCYLGARHAAKNIFTDAFISALAPYDDPFLQENVALLQSSMKS